jgi:hypothetical protein
VRLEIHLETKRSSELGDDLGSCNGVCWQFHVAAVNWNAVDLEAVDWEVWVMEAKTWFIG